MTSSPKIPGIFRSTTAWHFPEALIGPHLE
jgi:hypothetical protein